MTTQTTPDSAYEARAKALVALIDAVDVYKAFQTLEPTGLVHDECGDGLDDAVCDAAVDLLNADATYIEALDKPQEANPEPEPRKAKAPKNGPGSLESVKAAVIAAQKRGARTEALQKAVMEHGGRNGDVPSLKALPPGENAIKCIAAIEALPGREAMVT
jgi:hypothetical protein